ncbi:hypothetical protein EPN95_01125 [Patescibacteria group bacterium]|nr:MAG: hypothetical protein EPN95_01125 [Patescibacteria group bacterium]
MVTKKKSTTSKTRKTSVKSHAKKSSVSKSVEYHTLKLAADTPFLNAKVTRQTFYWSFLLLFIIIMQLIILAMNLNASLMFDSMKLY